MLALFRLLDGYESGKKSSTIPLTFCSAFLRKNPPDRFGIFDEFEKVEKLN